MRDFARWLNGSLTRFCGYDVHDRCKGMISTVGIEAPCLCDCHQRAAPISKPMSHNFDNAPAAAPLSKPECGEQVKRSYGRFIRPGWEPCHNTAKWRVDGIGRFGTLYSDVPMCSTHRAKYDRAGYRSWPIVLGGATGEGEPPA